MNVSQCTSCGHEQKGMGRVCPLCNGTMKQAIEDGDRNCPRCRTQLEINHFNHHDIDVCPSCEGMWIEPEVFRVLTTEFDVYKDPEANPNFERKGLPKGEPYLPCANCSQLMTRQHFQKISGVMIDMCQNCGVWLDKDELTQIRNFIASGGLDRAQDNKFEKHVNKMDRELYEMDKRVSDLEFMDRVMNQFDGKWWRHKWLRK